MIVDAHTHIFPTSIIERRAALTAADPLFSELYRAPRSRMATATDLLAAIDRDSIDGAVVAGITWRDAGVAIEHNRSLLAAALANPRLAALCCVCIAPRPDLVSEMERCAAAGAAGFGELRLDSYAAFDPDLPRMIAETAARLRLPLLLHASEPVGHAYPGKSGGSLELIWRLLIEVPSVSVILGHLGGGLPFYAHMPEVRERLRSVYIDTAAAPWLYDAAAVRLTVDLVGADRVLFGSDFPLRRPGRDLRWLARAGLDALEMEQILGRNAIRAFRLDRT